jgi:hypothetical protein
MDDRALNALTIVVLTPLFVVASVGALFLMGARPTWRGGLASFLSASTAVGIPLFAFRWRSGTPFLDALVTAAWASPLIVAGFILALFLRSPSGIGDLLAWWRESREARSRSDGDPPPP